MFFNPGISTNNTLQNSSIDFMTTNNQILKQGMINWTHQYLSQVGASTLTAKKTKSLHGKSHSAALIENVRGHCWYYSTEKCYCGNDQFRHNENKSSIEITAISAACLGFIFPSPRHGTKPLALILTALQRLTVNGPKGSGKTHLVMHHLRHQRQCFNSNIEQVVYSYSHFQPIDEELLLSLRQQNFHLCHRLDWSVLDKVIASNKPKRSVLDDIYQEVSDTEEFLNLAISGRNQLTFIGFET